MSTDCDDLRPVIFIIADQLCAIHTLPPEIRENFTGFHKWSKRCINLMNHYVTSIPCSPSRATIYTGRNSNITKITDNTNNSWQPDLATVEEGLNTMGTYFKEKDYKTRYIGKFHLTKELDRQVVLKFKPTVATQDYLRKYDFDIYDKEGDAGFGVSGGFFSDVDVLEKKLPNGNDKHACDYYDEKTNTAYDGAFPYLKKRYNKRDKKFLCVINFRNPHDITYNDTIPKTENPTSGTATLQFSGNPASFDKTNGTYNKHYRMFFDIPILNYDSIIYDNAIESKTNLDPLYVARIFYLATKYYAYGISRENILSYKYYQTSYLQMLKQLDSQLIQLYDFLENYDYFNTAVIVLGSDHSEMNGSHGLVGKGSMIYNTAWQVSTFISYPHMPHEYKGYKHKGVTSNLQLTPTVMLLSNLESEKHIERKGLYPPIFRYSKNEKNYKLNNCNFKNLKLNVSIGYGPIFLPLLRSLNVSHVTDELNAAVPQGLNYFTIPGLSVSANISLNKKLYNVGYYFSIFHVFSTNYEGIIPPLDFLESRIPLIMTNAINSGGVAFVGTPLHIYQQFFGNVYFVDEYFKNAKIEPFEGEIRKQYKPLILPPTRYGTFAFTNSSVFTESNVAHFLESLTPQPIHCPTSTLYDNVGTTGGRYCYYGNTAYIKFLLATNPVVRTWTNPTIVHTKPRQYHVYVMNDPFYQKAQLWTKTTPDIPIVIRELNLIDYIKKLFTLSREDISAFILGNISYSVFDSVQLIVAIYLRSLNRTKLPGQNMDVDQLLRLGYQVQVFDDTEDEQELYNLADSSRINEHRCVINELLCELNQHIKYNNCEEIYIALPFQLIFTHIFDSLKTYLNNDVPLMYNYSLLEDNYYNKMNHV